MSQLKQAVLSELQPSGAINIRVPVVIIATGVPQTVPGFPVPPGAAVTLDGIHGQTVNTDDVFVGASPEELNGGGRRVPKGASLSFPVDNTGQIWFTGTQGDGLLISITRASVG